MTTFPKDPKYLSFHYDLTDEKWYVYMGAGEGYCEAYLIHSLYTDADALAVAEWLREHRISRLTFTGALQPEGATPAILYQHSATPHRIEMAVPGDTLVDQKKTWGVMVYNPPHPSPVIHLE